MSDPAPARNVVTSVWWICSLRPGMLPSTAPTRISTRATERPILMLISDANSAMAIQMANM